MIIRSICVGFLAVAVFGASEDSYTKSELSMGGSNSMVKVNLQDGPIQSFAPLVEKTAPSIVSVTASSNTSSILKIDGVGVLFRNNSPRKALGSGVIFDKSGLVLTNHHVIDEANATYTVKTCKDRIYKAEVVIQDHITDLAILRIKQPVDGGDVTKEFPTMNIGDATDSKIGDVVLAMGNNLGFAHTVTQGVISHIGRTMHESEAVGQGQTSLTPEALKKPDGSDKADPNQPYIQTDASVNQGSSGGALINVKGELIGINTAIVSPGQGGGNVGVAFAVPSNFLHPIIKAATEGKPMLWPQDGIIAVTNTEKGVKIEKIEKNSPAEKAGIKVKDVLTAVKICDGGAETTTVSTPRVSYYKMQKMSFDVGKKYKYQILRNDKEALSIDIVMDGSIPPQKPKKNGTDDEGLAGALGSLFGGGGGGMGGGAGASEGESALQSSLFSKMMSLAKDSQNDDKEKAAPTAPVPQKAPPALPERTSPEPVQQHRRPLASANFSASAGGAKPVASEDQYIKDTRDEIRAMHSEIERMEKMLESLGAKLNANFHQMHGSDQDHQQQQQQPQQQPQQPQKQSPPPQQQAQQQAQETLPIKKVDNAVTSKAQGPSYAIPDSIPHVKAYDNSPKQEDKPQKEKPAMLSTAASKQQQQQQQTQQQQPQPQGMLPMQKA